MVLILLGIISAVVFSRLSGPSTFDSLAASDAIISIARSAQQHALGREDVTLNIEQSGSDWKISAKEGNGAVELRSLSISSRRLELETGSTASTVSTCATAFDTAVASDFSVAFDSQGNALTLTNNSSVEGVSNGVRICVNDDDALSVCISPGGFAHRGACEI